MDEYKSINKYLNKKRKPNNKTTKNKKILFQFLNKCLISIFLFVLTLCIIKIYPNTKEIIYKNVYQTNFSFASINSNYEKYFGSILPIESYIGQKTETVFNENLVYNHKEKYNEGVKLTVNKSYLMPALESGIVVFKGNKELYGETIIVQQVDGVDLWYVNVNSDSVKLYDYVEKGSLLGECKDTEIYLYYQKNGEFLNYEKYLP